MAWKLPPKPDKKFEEGTLAYVEGDREKAIELWEQVRPNTDDYRKAKVQSQQVRREIELGLPPTSFQLPPVEETFTLPEKSYWEDVGTNLKREVTAPIRGAKAVWGGAKAALEGIKSLATPEPWNKLGSGIKNVSTDEALAKYLTDEALKVLPGPQTIGEITSIKSPRDVSPQKEFEAGAEMVAPLVEPIVESYTHPIESFRKRPLGTLADLAPLIGGTAVAGVKGAEQLALGSTLEGLKLPSFIPGAAKIGSLPKNLRRVAGRLTGTSEKAVETLKKFPDEVTESSAYKTPIVKSKEGVYTKELRPKAKKELMGAYGAEDVSLAASRLSNVDVVQDVHELLNRAQSLADELRPFPKHRAQTDMLDIEKRIGAIKSKLNLKSPKEILNPLLGQESNAKIVSALANDLNDISKDVYDLNQILLRRAAMTDSEFIGKFGLVNRSRILDAQQQFTAPTKLLDISPVHIGANVVKHLSRGILLKLNDPVEGLKLYKAAIGLGQGVKGKIPTSLTAADFASNILLADKLLTETDSTYRKQFEKKTPPLESPTKGSLAQNLS